MEKLKYFLMNPYTWLFIIFIIALPYIVQYMRKFYPQKLQEQMAKEEACMLESNQKPEMKRLRRNMLIGLSVSFVLAIILSYSFNKYFSTVFAITSTPIILYSMISEYQINKDKNCLDIYDKREFFTQIGIYGGLVVLLVFIIIYFEIGRVR